MPPPSTQLIFQPGTNGLCKGCSAVDERRCTCAAQARLRSAGVRNKPCPKCGNSPPHEWVPRGAYLDKDLECKECGHVIDVWDC